MVATTFQGVGRNHFSVRTHRPSDYGEGNKPVSCGLDRPSRKMRAAMGLDDDDTTPEPIGWLDAIDEYLRTTMGSPRAVELAGELAHRARQRTW